MVPNLELLRTLAAVVETGSQRAAARERGISVATVSQHVHALEEALAINLFERVGRRSVPTREARELAVQLSRSFERIAAVVDEAVSSFHRVAGPISIGAPRPFGRHWLMPRLAELLRQQPGLVPVVRHGGPTMLEAELRGGGLDLAILVREPEHPGLALRELCHQQLIAVAAPGHVPEGSVRTVEAAREHRWIAFDHDLPLFGRWWRATFGNRSHVPAPGAYVSDPFAMRALAEEGLGITVLPKYLVSDARAAGRLVEVHPGPRRPATQRVVLAWRPDLPSEGRRAAVRDFLLSAP